jgi:hypothetical protein
MIQGYGAGIGLCIQAYYYSSYLNRIVKSSGDDDEAELPRYAQQRSVA